MKLLANENFPLRSVLYLKKKGFDISALGSDLLGIRDEEVMELAMKEGRNILTFDRDYGELIFKKNYKPKNGVVYLRHTDYTPEEPGQIVEKILLDSSFRLSQSLTVIDANGIRQRKYEINAPDKK